jgi:hypothetical protein
MMAVRATAQEIVDAVLLELGLPTGTIGATNANVVVTQCVALLNRLGDDAVAVHDWQELENVASFTGDGVLSQFPMPADFGRIVNQTEWSTNMRRPMIGPLTSQQWGWTQYGIVSVGVYFRYRILDNKLTIFPTPGIGEIFKLFYIQKDWVVAADGTTKDRVTLGTDSPIFDRDLMIAGVKLRLWAIKGFDTTQIASEYNYRLQSQMGQNQGAAVIHLSGGQFDFHYIDGNNVPDGSWS